MHGAADQRNICRAPRPDRRDSSGRTPRSSPRREPQPPSPDHSAAPLPPGHDGLYPWPAASALCFRRADKDDRRSAERAQEREPPVRREYTWPDVPVRAGGTKTERRLPGLLNVHSAWFPLATHAIVRTFAMLYQKPMSISRYIVVAVL